MGPWSYPSLDGALPVVGHLPEMYRRFPSLCARGARRCGPLFYIQGGPGARQLMCTDASAHDALKRSALSSSFYGEGFADLLGGTLFAFDGEEHRRVRGFMAPAFTPRSLEKTEVARIIHDEAARAIGGWIAQGRIAVGPATKELALAIIFRLVGAPVTDLPAWRRHYGRFLLAAIPSRGRIRGPIHRIAAHARRWLDGRLADLVETARRRGDGATLVGAIANSRDEAGHHLDTALVVANLRLLILAGHETSAAGLAWVLLHLAESEALQRRAADEAAGADPLALAQDDSRFTFAEAQFREALRLYPPVHSLVRRVTEPLSLPVGEVPPGTLLNVPLVHLLRDSARFAEPERYRPERLMARPRPGSLENAMFGGGPHFCLGYHLAMLEGTLVSLMIPLLMSKHGRRIRPERPGPVPGPIYLPLSHPPSRLSVSFE